MKTKYPLRRVVLRNCTAELVPGYVSKRMVLLECGHFAYPSSDFYGDTNPIRQRCRKCYEESTHQQIPNGNHTE